MKPSDQAPVILVVEDEPLLRDLSVYVLKDAGYQVMEASTADEALSIINSNSMITVMFTDINMPGSMDGLELARRCHRHWPDVRLIVTSGAGRVRSVDIPGGGRFLAKPYALSELSRAIGELAHQPARDGVSLH